ncbi:MAG: TetR/AcrR family transcriptional regulator [Myxococcales bacterium]|nr:TetR/AcrR family transcriptional regulator [Myxococcales bacterium]
MPEKKRAPVAPEKKRAYVALEKKRPPAAPDKKRDGEGDEQKREQRRVALREAAYKRFSERGYHLTSVDDICEEAGISKGSFYWYYDSKLAVLLAIVDGWAREVELSLTEHFRSTLESNKRRHEVTLGLQALARRLRRLMPLWLEFLSQAQREPAIRKGLSVFHRRVRRATHTLLGTLVEGFEDERESEALATIIVGGFIGLMALEISDPDNVTFAGKVEAFMSLLGHSSIEAESKPKAKPKKSGTHTTSTAKARGKALEKTASKSVERKAHGRERS